MILIGLGANLPSERYGAPRATLEAALGAFGPQGIRVVARSRWYSTAPVLSAPEPGNAQPHYVNAVVAVETLHSPESLLAVLHGIEADFGRQRGRRDAPRVIDLDLLDYNAIIRNPPLPAPVLPHPRLAGRAFVLQPLCDIDPQWRHPVLARSARELAAAVTDADIAVISPDA